MPQKKSVKRPMLVQKKNGWVWEGWPTDRSELWDRFRRTQSSSRRILRFRSYFAIAMYFFGLIGIGVLVVAITVSHSIIHALAGLMALSFAWTCTQIWMAIEQMNVALYSYEECSIYNATDSDLDKINQSAWDAYAYDSCFGGRREFQGHIRFLLLFVTPVLVIWIGFVFRGIPDIINGSPPTIRTLALEASVLLFIWCWRFALAWATRQAAMESKRIGDLPVLYF